MLSYADLRSYCSGDIAYQVPRAEAGSVLACLRTWLSVGEQIIPGRVIYGLE
jgi:hypothetical protein